MARALPKLESLVELDLSYNSLNFDSLTRVLTSLASLLRSNLRSLDLSYNVDSNKNHHC